MIAQPMPAEKTPARAVAALKIAVGVALLGWLISRVDARSVGAAFARARPGLLALGIALLFAQSAVQAVRLHLLVRHVTGALAASLHMIFVGLFLNNFLPGNIGGDGYKMLYLRRRDRTWSHAVAYVLYDRVLGLGAIVAGAGVYLAARGVPDGQWEQLHWQAPAWLGWVVAAAGAVAAAAVLAVPRVRVVARRMAAALAELPAATHAAIAVLAVATLGVQVVRFQVLAACFGVDVAALDWLYVIALSNVVALLPVSVGGLGVQEGVTVYALALFGVPLADGAAIALANRLAMWLGGVAGGVAFLRTRAPARAPDDPAP